MNYQSILTIEIIALSVCCGPELVLLLRLHPEQKENIKQTDSF